ncbi:putative zinc transporter 7 isoform X2 [Apostichopus japonicus]|uniref:Putative zinc transporter 7 isoform X2 n=1 Tax=Stichopus japonicus TaxID=307972 RepID=A0A2G8LD27_STIJA|nr:putative zinc transporter 7 isoform X2 [Apostichopus japonicus]
MLPLHAHDDVKGPSTGIYAKVTGWLRAILYDTTSRNLFCFLLLNLSFAFVELSYGIWTNSLGLISDSFHMFFDCTALLAGLVATVISKWRANDRFTYGYVRTEILAGFVNGLFLLFIAFFIFSEAVERALEPPEVRHERLFVVSVLGFIVNLVGIFAFHHGQAHGHSHSSSNGGVGHGHSHGGGHSHSQPAPSHGHGHSGHGHSHGLGLGSKDEDEEHHHTPSSSETQILQGNISNVVDVISINIFPYFYSAYLFKVMLLVLFHSYLPLLLFCMFKECNISNVVDIISFISSNTFCVFKCNISVYFCMFKCNISNVATMFLPILLKVYFCTFLLTLSAVGVIVSAILMQMFGWMIVDPLCSMFIALLIMLSVLPLLRDSISVLMMRTPYSLENQLPSCYQRVTQLEGVYAIHEPHFWTLCSDVYVGTLKLEIAPNADAKYIISQTHNIFTQAGLRQLFVQTDYAAA